MSGLRTQVRRSDIAPGGAATLGSGFSAVVVADTLARHQRDLDAVVIDEFHRLPATTQRAVVQLMKVLADRGVAIAVIAIGNAEWGERLWPDREYRDYVGRNITAVALPPMTTDELRDIIDRRVADGVQIPDAVAAKLTWVAGGYPGIIHTVMSYAGVQWLASNSAALLTPTAKAVASALAGSTTVFRSVAEALIAAGVLHRVKLKKARMLIGSTEVGIALEQHAKFYETVVLGGLSFRKVASDARAKRVLKRRT
jgi:hypothetical protein